MPVRCFVQKNALFIICFIQQPFLVFNHMFLVTKHTLLPFLSITTKHPQQAINIRLFFTLQGNCSIKILYSTALSC